MGALNRKERRATLVPAPVGDRVESAPPIRPAGCSLEFWLGAVGLDRALTVWDAGVNGSGDQVGSAVSFSRDFSQRDREVLADYMIDLWARFRAGEKA